MRICVKVLGFAGMVWCNLEILAAMPEAPAQFNDGHLRASGLKPLSHRVRVSDNPVQHRVADKELQPVEAVAHPVAKPCVRTGRQRVARNSGVSALSGGPPPGEHAASNYKCDSATFLGLVQPVWSNALCCPNGFEATLATKLPSSYCIEYSDDLSSWRLLTTLTNVSQPVQVWDVSVLGVPRRFYRAVSAPFAAEGMRYLKAVMDQYHLSFDVFTDADAAGNHFSVRAKLASAGGDPLVLLMDETSVENPLSGTTCIKASWKRQFGHWGGWY